MATQKCPKCKSNRVRLGYHHTPLILKFAFTYNLLCDDCNWEFKGFAIPGTVPRRTKKKKTSKEIFYPNPVFIDVSNDAGLIKASDELDDLLELDDDIESLNVKENIIISENKNISKPKKKIKKRVRVKLH